MTPTFVNTILDLPKRLLQQKCRHAFARFTVWLTAVLVAGSAPAATITITNPNTNFDGYHAVVDVAGTPLSGTGAGGNVGRMTLSDSEITALVTARNFTALNAAFTPFGTDGGTFSLSYIEDGVIEAPLETITKPSVNAFGGSTIFVWLFKGASRTTATEFFLAKLNSVFPTDPEVGPFSFPVDVFLRPSTIVTLFAGSSGPETFDYGLGSAATVLRMASAAPTGGNQRPVATNGNLDAIAGIAKSGQLVGSDPEDDPITFSKVSDPSKGTVQIQSNGSFVYTATVGQTGADSFTFKVNDGALDSDPATVSITISAAPPNQPPEAIPGMISGFQNDLLTGFMMATDPEDDALTYSVVSGPANGTLSFASSGSFRYLPNHQFVGEDSFTFTANDGGLTSAPVRVVIMVQPATPGWAWMTGEQTANLNGSYGTLGTPSGANRPGSRSLSAYSASGAVLYMFGGQGRGETGGAGLLNDLWRFDSRTQEWTWMSGGKGINAPGNYGTQGQAAPERVPGGRSGGVLWVDDEGLVWLFGGTGRGTSATATGELNDLWRFNPVSGQWTWVRGSDGVNANGVYGTLGLQAGANGPGARAGAVGWRDGRGQLWLFGGRGRGATRTTTGLLNDVWRFDPVASEWAHYHGATGINAFGRYGVDGKEVPNQGPGGRSGASAWYDADGLLWLFGGQGFASSGAAGFLNDLWVFDTGAKQWRGGIFRPSSGTWRTSPGPDRTNVAGVNGVLGMESPNNYPAARAGAVMSFGSEGKLFLFGGSGAGAFNDVWSFDPSTSNWTWLKGPARTNQPGIYGQKGVSSVSNTPGARSGGAGFLSPAGNLWVFGGAAGATSFSDGWRLRLPASSSVELEVIQVTTETTAEIEGLVNPGVVQAPTALFLDYAPMADRSSTTSLSLPLIPADSGATPVSQVLTGLQPGTDYWVNLVAMNGQSIARSRPRIFRTQGVAAPISVAFERADSTVLENNGSAQVEVRLSAPAGELITVPVTVSGTALPSDFTVPVASVVFLPGQLKAFFSVNLVNDTLVEADKTIQLDLGTPVPGSVILGLESTHELTLLDDDAAPFGDVNSVIAAVGDPVQLEVSLSKNEAFKYQWKKAGRRIAGATGATLSFNAVKLTDAGSYTVDVTLPRGGVLSFSAQLAVVDATPRRVLGRVGVEVRLPSAVAGDDLEFEWRKVGDAAIIGTVSTRTFSAPQLSDAGDYTCTVILPGVGQVESHVTLNIVTEAPVLNLTELPDGFVGSSYRYDLAASNLPAGEADRFTVTGLPRGMVADSRGRITGVPTAAVINRLITITATNPIQSVQRTVFLTVNPLPAALPGTYGAWFVHEVGFAGLGLGGRIDVTLAPTGSFTARVQTGTDIRTARGPVSVSVDGSELTLVAQLVRRGAPTLELDLTLVAAPLAGAMELQGFITDLSNGLTTPVEGVKLAAQTARVGSYHYGLRLDESLVGVLAVPQGDGFGVANVLATGRASFVGRAGDGSPYTASAVVGKDGEVPIYLSAVSLGTPGGIVGKVEVTVATAAPFINGLSGECFWGRVPAVVRARTRSYRAGFECLPLKLMGGTYAGPAVGGIIGGLPAVPNNLEILFENRALIEGALASQTLTIENAGGVKQKVIIPTVNPAGVTFRLDSAPGSFSGGFTLAGATPALTRRAVFQGLFVRMATGSFMPVGYFLLAQPPEPGVPVSAAPELSGQVLFD